MYSEAIEKIREAETLAENNEKKAREEADLIAEKAGLEIERLKKEAEEAGKARLDEMTEKANDFSKQASLKSREKTAFALEELGRASGDKYDRAYEIIRKKLISG